MDPYVHTVIAIVCMYASYAWGRRTNVRESIERFTEFLEEQGYVHIHQTKDGDYEFTKHWKAKNKED